MDTAWHQHQTGWEDQWNHTVEGKSESNSHRHRERDWKGAFPHTAHICHNTRSSMHISMHKYILWLELTPPPPQLTETKERCEKALEEKALPLDVVLECLSLREQRVSIDLVRDDVEAELHKVSGMVAGLTDYYGHPMIAYAVIQFQCIYELFVFCCRSLRRSKGSGALSMRMLTLHLSKSVCCRTVTKGFALTSQTNTQHWPLTQNAWTSQISLRPFHSRRTPHALRRSELHC